MGFLNRADAGCQLGHALRAHHPVPPVVIGLTCGGVPVAAEAARILGAPLEICVVRKLVAPGDPPITFGAVAEGAVHFETAPLEKLKLPPATIDRIVRQETAEVARLSQLLRDHRPLELRGRDVVVVDDGVILGTLMRAAIHALRAHHPRSLELAVPVANSTVLDELRREVDRVVCLDSDPFLAAVGARYREFSPVSAAAVAGLLAIARPSETDAMIAPARI